MRTLGIAISILLLGAPLAAQQPGVAGTSGTEPVDRVIAVVGDTVLLLSDVQAAIGQLEASGQPVPTDPAQRAAMLQDVMQARISDLIIVEAAKAENVTVSQDELEQQVDARIRSVMQPFGTEAQFDAALAAEGLNRARYRQLLLEQERTQAVMDTYLRQATAKRTLPVVSEDQIRRAFEERKASLGQAPVRISLQQVIVKTQAADSAMAKALATAQQVLRELQEGADFEVLARRYSDDPGSKEAGGDLGWFRTGGGRMVPEFQAVADALRPGQTSGIVRTDFGYHIIRLDRVRGAERKARHILIRPVITPGDTERARVRADSVAAAMRAGANPAALARSYGTPSSEAEAARVPLDQLPPTYRQALQTATSGQVIGPIMVEGSSPSFAIVKLTERQEAGEYTLADVRERLVQSLQQQQMMEQLVGELRNRVHVEVLP
ncbi:MAG: peptidylprolyl isomerase [Gemmatimonadetes bacterium]|nr:peptidylprolyl isomerase [Gemmatimonadota bacterium]